MTPNETVACAHHGCVCEIPRDKALQRDRQYYCSEECVSGRGCHHGACDCGVTMVAPPAEDTESSAPTPASRKNRGA